MYIPLPRERVRVAGTRGVFLVLSADYERQAADLAKLNDSNSMESGAPFDSLRAPFEQPSPEHVTALDNEGSRPEKQRRQIAG